MRNFSPATKKYKLNLSNPVFKITAWGLIIRLAVLIFILTLGREFSEPYFIADDLKYENLAKAYMDFSKSAFNMPLFDELTAGYMELFWPWIMCISAYIFNYVYASRFINICLSTFCIPIIYKITYLVSKDKQTAKRAASLFAFLPITIFTSCFPIKDIFITLSVLYAFYIFLLFQNEKHISTFKLILCIALLTATYFTRGAVCEILILFFAIFLIMKYIKQKNHVAVLICITALVLSIILFGSSFLSAFDTKIENYSEYGDSGGGIFGLKINGITDMYKLPFTYFFATLQPIRINLFGKTGASFWLDVISTLNLTMYPIAIGNFIYIFYKKKNFYFWLSTTIMFCSVIILSLGIFRHYLFLLPCHLINYSLYVEKNKNNNIALSIIAAVFMFFGIMLLSIL